jgi:hypothetical protein
LLENGPLPQLYIQEQYSNEGYSNSTIRRAKSALQIKSIKEGGPLGDDEQQWLWSLPNSTNEGMG